MTFDQAKAEIDKAESSTKWPFFGPRGNQLLPEALHHYTTALGMVGILKQNVLWASVIHLLNDWSELQYGHDLIHSYLAKSKSHLAEAALIKQPQDAKNSSLYVACFCEDGDLLSQWRGYSNRRDGYSMAFRTAKLLGIKKVMLMKMIYNAAEQEELIENMFQSFTSVLSQAGNLDGHEKENLLTYAANAFWSLAFRFKDNAFRSEHEWRLVGGEASNYEERFRVDNGQIVPYIALPLESDALIEVRQGPGHYQQYNLVALQRFLIDTGYASVKVSRSPIPLI